MNSKIEDFKLSTEVTGHTLDVRSVAYANNCIVSGSRDKTVRIFEKLSDGKSFKQTELLTTHTNYVSSVCIINNGNWICTGSNDKTICLFNFGIVQPFAVLKSHTETVCCLSQGNEPKTLLSGSWDKTARIWSNLDIDSSSIELTGHEATVWGVCSLKNGKYATGSADKNIFIWNNRGEKLVVLKGHTDCVRALVGLEDGSLLSASNDATIRHWSDTYDCIREYHGHSNYIYSIALNPALGDLFVTGSEDNTIRLWSVKEGALGESLSLPVQSVWSVACMDNGDIISGSSDGIIRVFSKDPSRVASDDVLSAYDTSVSTRKLEQSKELGGVKVNDLPGPESLLKEGTEGQTKIVRHSNGKIMCYEWKNGKWEVIGDVVGAPEQSKTLYEGKEYDFVFNVDIEDGQPPIKLPFNSIDDPWLAAQNFIHKHDLPQVYLDQVANFIIKNAKLTSAPSTSNPDFEDPFTGGGRYVPSFDSNQTAPTSNVNVNFREQSNGSSGLVNSDPFTGGSSYSSGKKEFIVQKHIPFNIFTTFEAFDASKILAKIKEFNNEISDDGIKATEEELENVVQLMSLKNINDQSISTLNKLMKWPKEKLFPVLDIIRLAVRNAEICDLLGGNKLMDYLTQYLNTTPANQLMSIRALNNMMLHDLGKNLVNCKVNDVCNMISSTSQGNANLQNAIATFFLNESIIQKDMKSDDICVILSIGALRAFEWITDPEATFRGYQALGNLITYNSQAVLSILKSADTLKASLERNQHAQIQKLSEISLELTEKLI
ncbi:unnamed protein product [Chironomus riparius]|uniref:Phospholipase A-2-activating protein n=1 Tax=Chironomus riparius TaxID=315576 RepID=A0A9N9S197_9DIPT|nr:unnamed protein product [Chironomus riparius]